MFWLLFHLRVAYSTELGASRAYRGHSRATRDPELARYIAGVEQDELHHRAFVAILLERYGARPFYPLEALFFCIGTVVGLGCHVWGDWASAFGAAQLELGGMGDYRRAAAAARRLGKHALAVQLDAMGEQEAAHRRFFQALARSRLPLPLVERPPLVWADHPPHAHLPESPALD